VSANHLETFDQRCCAAWEMPIASHPPCLDQESIDKNQNSPFYLLIYLSVCTCVCLSVFL